MRPNTRKGPEVECGWDMVSEGRGPGVEAGERGWPFALGHRKWAGFYLKWGWEALRVWGRERAVT